MVRNIVIGAKILIILCVFGICAGFVREFESLFNDMYEGEPLPALTIFIFSTSPILWILCSMFFSALAVYGEFKSKKLGWYIIFGIVLILGITISAIFPTYIGLYRGD